MSCLEREGARIVFAYPGGASMPIHQALTKSKKIRVVLPRHEQGGAFAAEGYARATGRRVFAWRRRVPARRISSPASPMPSWTRFRWWQSPGSQSKHDRAGSLSGDRCFGMTLPMVKHSYLVWDINDIPRIVKEAFFIAQTGRPGPVLIDIPKNIQMARTQPIYPRSVKRGYNPIRKAEDVAIHELIGLIEHAKKPLIYCGGVITGNASKELAEFAERTQIPVTTTLMGIGGFPEDHPLSLKWLGMHGTVYANNAANEADLLLAIGVRFDDRVTGKVEKF